MSLLLALALLSQPPQGPMAKPQPAAAAHPYRFKVHPDATQHLGSVGPREIRQITYRIENLSDRPLGFKLQDLSEGLSLVAGELDTPLAPKVSRELAFSLDPTGHAGYQRRSARLVPDDPDQPRFVFRLDMTVRADLTVDAPKKAFGPVAPHERPELVFTFKRETEEPLALTLESQAPPHLETEVVPTGKGAAELRLVLHPERLEPGVHLGLETLQLTSNAPLQPKFTLYADWSLDLPVRPDPARVVFLQAKPDPQVLQLRAANDQPFRILAARLEGEGFAVDPLPQPAAVQKLTLRRTGSGSAQAVLVIEMEGQPELRVPLAHRPPE